MHVCSRGRSRSTGSLCSQLVSQAPSLRFCSCVSAGVQLEVPANVTMVTLNTNYTLRWDWDQSWSRDVSFTVEYVGYVSQTGTLPRKHLQK